MSGSGIVAVLYARADSHYKALPGVDVWDAERDARNWPGGVPVVAHPPCRGWGRMRQFATCVRPDEKDLALHAVKMVRAWGGVLEHPRGSTLWGAAGLPLPGEAADGWGGFTIEVDQYHWGHRAQKPTWLYLVGVDRVPVLPVREGRPTHYIRPPRNGAGFKVVTKAEREHTPKELAAWLVDMVGGAK
jgi:hypothetical protein